MPRQPFILDGVKMLQHYATCLDMAVAEEAAAIDELEKAEARGAVKCYRALFEGMRLAAERAGFKVTIQPRSAH